MFVLVRPAKKNSHEDFCLIQSNGAPVEKNQLPRCPKIMRPKCLDNHSARCLREENNRVLFSSHENSTDALFLKEKLRSNFDEFLNPHLKQKKTGDFSKVNLFTGTHDICMRNLRHQSTVQLPYNKDPFA